ncbi:MAG: fluoride efflux transporter CrcB [Solirubrobacteraceae bacterium]|nr:fluoride efflux transporter CrcB [Solirubrobacteraceae bacterium]
MSVLTALAVAVLGGAGALARFALDGAISRRSRGPFPWGTLAVNLSGSFALGVLVGVALGGEAHRLLATGLLGAYTTFSTWMLEAERLGEDGRLALGLTSFAASLLAGVLVAWLGRELGVAL